MRNPQAVDVLLQISAARRLAPFMREPHTLGTAAAELEMPASSLAYWMKRFLRAGLVEVVELRRRAGKPIPVYRATADEFRVPLDAMPPGAREEFIHGGRRHAFDLFSAAVENFAQRHLREGLRIRCDPHRGVEMTFGPEVGDRPVPITEFWGMVMLTDEEAAQLHSELEAISSRYTRSGDGRGRRPHLLMVGLAPDSRRR